MIDFNNNPASPPSFNRIVPIYRVIKNFSLGKSAALSNYFFKFTMDCGSKFLLDLLDIEWNEAVNIIKGLNQNHR